MPHCGHMHILAQEFQSAPDREVGRCPAASRHASSCSCFNPRPTVRSGDAAIQQLVDNPPEVSIRARP